MIIGLFGYVLKVYKDDELVYIGKASDLAVNDILFAAKALGLGMSLRDAKSIKPMLEDVSSKKCVWRGSYRFETCYNPYPA